MEHTSGMTSNPMAPPAVPADVDLTDLRRFDDGIPHDVFTRLRREAPVAWHPERAGAGFWCVTRYADVVDVNRDNPVMSTAPMGPMIFDQPYLAEPDAPRMMIDMDPAQHTRYRLLVNREFIPRQIKKLDDPMLDITARTLDRVIDRGAADFVED